jgi:hypothetical protein
MDGVTANCKIRRAGAQIRPRAEHAIRQILFITRGQIFPSEEMGTVDHN